VYRAEIEQAIALGFVKGFEDQTFRPLAAVTREQVVSLVIEALLRLPNTTLNVPAKAAGNPYPDVERDRWSAAKVGFARDVGIVSGYPDGTFKPTQAVKRAELIALLRRAAEYGKTMKRLSSQLTNTNPQRDFPDLGTHWSASLVTQMSGYCRVASPLNEEGSDFVPELPAQRNYAAAATLRMLNCVNQELR
jgi:hypothetical protein